MVLEAGGEPHQPGLEVAGQMAAGSRGCGGDGSTLPSAAAIRATVMAELAPSPPPRGESLARSAPRKAGAPSASASTPISAPSGWRGELRGRARLDHTLALADAVQLIGGAAEAHGDGEVDRHVDGAGLGLEEAERPDVEGAAGQVDPAPGPLLMVAMHALRRLPGPRRRWPARPADGDRAIGLTSWLPAPRHPDCRACRACGSRPARSRRPADLVPPVRKEASRQPGIGSSRTLLRLSGSIHWSRYFTR